MPSEDIRIEEVPCLAGCNSGAGAATRDDQPFRREHLQTLAHRLPADAVSRGELGFTWQIRTLRDRSGDDLATDLMGDPAMQGGCGVEAFLDQGSGRQAF